MPFMKKTAALSLALVTLLAYSPIASAQGMPEGPRFRAEIEELRAKVRMDKARVEQARAELKADLYRLHELESRMASSRRHGPRIEERYEAPRPNDAYRPY